MSVLITGGTGYIGSHTCVQLLQQGYNAIIVDNLCNSKRSVIERIEQITGIKPTFYEMDLADENAVKYIFQREEINSVIHFAALKAVSESVISPLKYYENNLRSTLNLLKSMKKHSVKKLIYSSSATVYGQQESFPIKEDAPLSITSPYGATKIMNEQILYDFYQAHNDWGMVFLRYFNPIGAHESALIGEEPNALPNNLMPIILNVAKGKLQNLSIYGNDYNTKDGTCIRDYIHIMDIADGHIAALSKIENAGVSTYNLGTGLGYSVLELIKTFENVNHCTIPYKFVDRRPGDIETCYADVMKAKEELKWNASRSLDQMCKDAWAFAKASL